jgi:Tfp pilus assembly protein PilO
LKARPSRFDVREASGKIALLLFAALIANVAATVFLVRPRVLHYRELTDLTNPQFQVVKTREKDVVQKEQYRAGLEKARDDMKHLAGDVLSTRQRRMIGVQFEVAKLARDFNVASNQVHYENPPAENGALERFGVVIPLAGGYTNLRKFVQAVESSDNFLVIERVALGTGKSTDLVELNITLATYFISPDSQLDQLGKAPIAPAKSSS